MRLTPSSIIAITVFFISVCVPISKAQPVDGPVVTVIHVDARPADTQAAVILLDGFRRGSLRDSGAKDFQVLQEIGHPNHFTLVETWLDQKAYEAHNLARHTIRFRNQLQPMLASPFDERIHSELSRVP